VPPALAKIFLMGMLTRVLFAVHVCCVCPLVSSGFEQSMESQHVMELGVKLASFDIETDTDVSVYPTDAGPCDAVILSCSWQCFWAVHDYISVHQFSCVNHISFTLKITFHSYLFFRQLLLLFSTLLKIIDRSAFCLHSCEQNFFFKKGWWLGKIVLL